VQLRDANTSRKTARRFDVRALSAPPVSTSGPSNASFIAFNSEPRPRRVRPCLRRPTRGEVADAAELERCCPSARGRSTSSASSTPPVRLEDAGQRVLCRPKLLPPPGRRVIPRSYCEVRLRRPAAELLIITARPPFIPLAPRPTYGRRPSIRPGSCPGREPCRCGPRGGLRLPARLREHRFAVRIGLASGTAYSTVLRRLRRFRTPVGKNIARSSLSLSECHTSPLLFRRTPGPARVRLAYWLMVRTRRRAGRDQGAARAPPASSRSAYVVQHRALPAHRTSVFNGKLEELKEPFKESNAESVIRRGEARPSQQR